MTNIFSRFLLLFRKSPKLPHEIFPELLRWQEGDKINTNGSGFTYTFISCDEKGEFYLKRENFDDYWRFDLKKIQTLTNISLQNREIKAQIEQSDNYWQLLQEFQKAVKELQERD
jgi:hypothetical protein